MSNFLLLIFALPIATIIIASVLEIVWKNPFVVTAFIFAIYLIVTFAAFDATFLVFAIIYTILALISALVTRAIINLINDNDDDNSNNHCCNNNNNNGISTASSEGTCGCNLRNSRCYNNRYYR